jgi:hypothetical protein
MRKLMVMLALGVISIVTTASPAMACHKGMHKGAHAMAAHRGMHRNHRAA